MEWLSYEGKLIHNNIDGIVEDLSFEWLDIEFDDIVKQVENLVYRYLE